MAAKRHIRFKKKAISQAQQFLLAKEKFSNARLQFRRGKWYLKLSLQPTAFSPYYPVEITKNGLGYFEVWLVGNIEKIDDPSFPHNYRIDKKNQRVQLCLYHPRKAEWDKLQLIHETIIPWICDWLYYYELWLDDGIWRGGGEHPQ